MKQSIASGALLLLLATHSLKSSSQTGTRLTSVDALTAGRGGTSTGTFDNPSLIINNPAGLSFLSSAQLDASFALLAPSTHFQNGINNTDGKKNIFPLFSLGYAAKPGKKFIYGLGIYTQGGLGADFTLNHYLYKDNTGNYAAQDYHSKFAVLQGGGSLAYKFNNQFSAGITATVVYSQLEFGEPFSVPPALLQGVINPQTGATFGNFFSAAPPNGLGYTELVAGASIKGLTALGFNGKIGLAYKPAKNVSIGLTYSLPVTLNYKSGTATLDMNAQFNDAFGRVVAGIIQQTPGTTPQQAQQQAASQFSQLGIDLTKGAADNYSAKAKLTLPQSIAAGISVEASKKLRLSADAEWINWADAFNTLDISLSGGTNTNVNRLLGTSGTISIPFPLQWKNAVVIRTGAEYSALNALTVRAGYVYSSNPVPASTVFPLFPAIVEHHLTLGASLKLSGAANLNLAYEHAFNNNQSASSASLAGAQYNNSISSLSTNVYNVSVSWKLK